MQSKDKNIKFTIGFEAIKTSIDPLWSSFLLVQQSFNYNFNIVKLVKKLSKVEIN